ncbi:LysE family transporter [Sporolactobacillus sp. CPB3-1]|uniref:LysE family transporter n=1 Tax=Sporolactobacillus mangiferae TaxID=2940498 RepID=A0ABT0M9F2_9BACL|nr:LysE family transporter [Sporolactobacillus mangiferae]MCL1631484.1 LysE family transporter [Sporolactobacillus mangiferae]
MFLALIHGFVLALGLILPLGAQNIFIFTQGTQAKRAMQCLPAVLTAAVSDTFLILLAVEGASLILLSHPFLKEMLLLVGSILLLIIGWSIWHSPSETEEGTSNMLSAKRQMLFAASVSLLNPHAVLDTVGVIGTNALNYDGNEKWAFAIACICVSWIWFFGLAITGQLLGKTERLKQWMIYINKLSAVLVWMIGGYLLIQFLHGVM